ncbi:unnamed protein product [Toxocara canis]|uniref:Acetyltransf_18 domain-containing protein n=1 Tax=Toxocara canis TaxID=6265 RepID=A0A183UNZ0_TOXCA|nr:unnamed protein product [Toxocara canis]
MLTSAALWRLHDNTKSDGVLCGRLLPLNSNAAFVDGRNVSTVTIVDETPHGIKPVAFGAFHIYSNSQAYFMVNRCERDYANKFFTVERYRDIEPLPNAEKNRHQCFKITATFKDDVNYSALPSYYGAFGKRDRAPLQTHLFDSLVMITLGTYNMDVNENITLDLYDPDEFDEEQRNLWRDRTGFVIIDKNRFYEITIKKSDLLEILNERQQKTLQLVCEQLCPGSEVHFQDYDSTLSIFSRQDYMDSLLRIKELKGVVALENNQPVGYALMLGDRLIQCYAENTEIARRLFMEICQQAGGSVIMSVKKCEGWICDEMLKRATRARRIQRLHTRIASTQVEWAKVFALNIGVHLF